MEVNESSIKRLIEDFSPMVHMWVERYKFMCPDYLHEDMVQEGFIGLLKAIRTYDPGVEGYQGRNTKFSTWVWWKTRYAVQRFARKSRGVPSRELIDVEYPYEESEECSLSVPNEEEIIMKGCGSLESVRAEVIKDKFGMMGKPCLKPKELSRKHGISERAISCHVYRFCKKIRMYHPELRDMLKKTEY